MTRRTSQKPIKKRWNYVGPGNAVGRPAMTLSWLEGLDTPHTFAIRQGLKYHQSIGVRDMMLYSEAKLIERRDDGKCVMHTYREDRHEISVWLVDEWGKREFVKTYPHYE